MEKPFSFINDHFAHNNVALLVKKILCSNGLFGTYMAIDSSMPRLSEMWSTLHIAGRTLLFH